jgi:hypothetical protein
MLKKDMIWRRYECLKFYDNKSPSFESLGKKCQLDVTFVKRHKIYYREGSGASSQKLQAM